MLVYQDVIGFRMWTGRDAPEAVMKQALRKALDCLMGSRTSRVWGSRQGEECDTIHAFSAGRAHVTRVDRGAIAVLTDEETQG
jgi:hypothetical protein